MKKKNVQGEMVKGSFDGSVTPPRTKLAPIFPGLLSANMLPHGGNKAVTLQTSCTHSRQEENGKGDT